MDYRKDVGKMWLPLLVLSKNETGADEITWKTPVSEPDAVIGIP